MKILAKIFMGFVGILIFISIAVGVFTGSTERGINFYTDTFQKYLTPAFFKTFVEPRQERFNKMIPTIIKPLEDLNKKNTMQPYTDRDNNSNIQGYRYSSDWIVVYFKDSSEYTYTVSSAGSSTINTMKNLADSGDGLNSFISTNRPAYESKR
jgi:hypothetical protein